MKKKRIQQPQDSLYIFPMQDEPCDVRYWEVKIATPMVKILAHNVQKALKSHSTKKNHYRQTQRHMLKHTCKTLIITRKEFYAFSPKRRQHPSKNILLSSTRERTKDKVDKTLTLRCRNTGLGGKCFEPFERPAKRAE